MASQDVYLDRLPEGPWEGAKDQILEVCNL